jgi:hypothetical protein
MGRYLRCLNITGGQIVRNGFTDVNVVSATLDFIFPVGGGLLAMIIIPGIVPHIMTHILHIQLPEHVASM